MQEQHNLACKQLTQPGSRDSDNFDMFGVVCTQQHEVSSSANTHNSSRLRRSFTADQLSDTSDDQNIDTLVEKVRARYRLHWFRQSEQQTTIQENSESFEGIEGILNMLE